MPDPGKIAGDAGGKVGDAAGGAKGVITRKVGPLPVWAWVGAAAAGIFIFTKVGQGSAEEPFVAGGPQGGGGSGAGAGAGTLGLEAAFADLASSIRSAIGDGSNSTGGASAGEVPGEPATTQLSPTPASLSVAPEEDEANLDPVAVTPTTITEIRTPEGNLFQQTIGKITTVFSQIIPGLTVSGPAPSAGFEYIGSSDPSNPGGAQGIYRDPKTGKTEFRPIEAIVGAGEAGATFTAEQIKAIPIGSRVVIGYGPPQYPGGPATPVYR